MNEYDEQANNFLFKTKTEISIKFLRHGKHFTDDNISRDIYEVTLKRGERKYVFLFGQSVINSGKYFWYSHDGMKKVHEVKHSMGIGGEIKRNKDFEVPRPYDVLACLTKYDIESFEDFCLEYGYNNDSLKAFRIYNAVKDEYDNLCKLFNEEEMQMLREIN